MTYRLSDFEVELIVEALDCWLYDRDQEYHFFEEEPTPKYYQVIEVRDSLLKQAGKPLD